MLGQILEYWMIWLPPIVVGGLHVFERSQEQIGVIYPDDIKGLMRKRIQIFSFQTEEEYNLCHLKGAKRIDINVVDPDAFLLKLEKKYPILCYCEKGIQSSRYFQRSQSMQKSYWLSGGLSSCKDKINRYCIYGDNDAEY